MRVIYVMNVIKLIQSRITFAFSLTTTNPQSNAKPPTLTLKHDMLRNSKKPIQKSFDGYHQLESEL